MGIRDALNKRPGLAVVGAAFVVAAAVILIYTNSGNSGPVFASRMFYSDDDGKSWFVDDRDKVFPFDHNGKQAYRAFVYECNGKQFVGYLARYSDSAKAQLLALAGREKDSDAAATIAEAQNNGIQVKRPGDQKWVGAMGSEGIAVASVKCPDGGAIKGVRP